MQRNTENNRWPETSFREILVREGKFISPGVAAITAAFLQQLCLQIHAEDVRIMVQKNGTAAYESGVTVLGR